MMPKNILETLFMIGANRLGSQRKIRLCAIFTHNLKQGGGYTDRAIKLCTESAPEKRDSRTDVKSNFETPKAK